MTRSVTPLPASLSGNIVERLIVLDEALLYLVNGALSWLCDKEPFEETGALTVDQAKTALSDMLWIYLTELPMFTPVGATMIWHMDTPPDRWLICDGAGVLKSEYPELFALFGAKYGESTDFFGLPDLRSRIPYGADFDIELDEEFGEETHTLITAEMPAHNHGVTDPGHIHPITLRGSLGAGSVARSGSNDGTTANFNTGNNTTGISIGNTGAGDPHNNMPPVTGVNFIVFGGKT